MLRLLYALLLGLLGAGIVHIAILFMLPAHSERDIWSRLSAAAPPYAMVRLGPNRLGGEIPAPVNPFLTAAACRFDLADGPVHVEAEGAVPFWSMSIYDSNGLNVFSISDRTAADGALDVVALDPGQMQRIRGELPAEFAQSVFIETGVEEGIVLVRAFVPDETWQGVVGRFFSGLSCTPRPVG
ncbi:DUF1254 domain-containing protein [Chelativorans sp.]|uniref:DUF1254 domain-containing protein n=1 Tax=Chelativorans sp. TaxID=2203393 RepID=UPI002811C1A0|nr:DUF1254 domain-containing protein [Chelativorans sp.]